MFRALVDLKREQMTLSCLVKWKIYSEKINIRRDRMAEKGSVKECLFKRLGPRDERIKKQRIC